MCEVDIYYSPDSFNANNKVDLLSCYHNVVVVKKGTSVKDYIYRKTTKLEKEDMTRLFFNVVFGKDASYQYPNALMYERVNLLSCECVGVGTRRWGPFLDSLDLTCRFYYKYIDSSDTSQLLKLLGGTITNEQFVHNANNEMFKNYVSNKFVWFAYNYMTQVKKTDLAGAKYITGLIYILKEFMEIKDQFGMLKLNPRPDACKFILTYLNNLINPKLLICSRLERIFCFILNTSNYDREITSFADKLIKELYLPNANETRDTYTRYKPVRSSEMKVELKPYAKQATPKTQPPFDRADKVVPPVPNAATDVSSVPSTGVSSTPYLVNINGTMYQLPPDTSFPTFTQGPDGTWYYVPPPPSYPPATDVPNSVSTGAPNTNINRRPTHNAPPPISCQTSCGTSCATSCGTCPCRKPVPTIKDITAETGMQTGMQTGLQTGMQTEVPTPYVQYGPQFVPYPEPMTIPYANNMVLNGMPYQY